MKLSGIVIIFIVFATSPFISGQKQMIDSLYKLIQTLPEDTSKINPYYEFGMTVESISFDSAVYYYKKAKFIADKYNNIKGKIRYASIYCTILNEQGNLKESYELSLEALRLTEQYHLYFDVKSYFCCALNHSTNFGIPSRILVVGL